MAWCVAVCILVITATRVYGQKVVDERVIQKAHHFAPELFMKAPDRAEKDGYPMETHYVLTDDDYVLALHRIPGEESSPPVLFQHGQTSMSDSWIAFSENRSLAYQLWENGYDVWLGNVRGNLYCKNHITMKPSDPEFWKFSWHEMGMYDLAASIDYILNTTGHEQLFYVGHSMGGTMAYVLLSMRPEYNTKMRLVINLSSSAFGSHVTSLSTYSGTINWGLFKAYLDVTGSYELLPYSESTIAELYFVCGNSTSAHATCKNLFSQTFGKSDGVSEKDVPLLAVMGMGGISAFTAWHYVQVVQTGKFQQFNFGPEENQRRYGSREPPEYNLKMVTAPVAIHYGYTDEHNSEKDILRVAAILPNVTEIRKVPAKYFNHLDFISHKRAKELLYDHIVNSLEEY
ncbi:lipase 3 [Anabrus simplex]|uniref:lipase 3 n=1 Tax=Anabrus simplex TaxID=316456 RepID=UPI0035A30DF5